MAKKYIPFFCLLTAEIIWGFLPIYFDLLDNVSPVEIVFHRILWSCVFLITSLVLSKKIVNIFCLIDVKKLLLILFAAILIFINSLAYIYAVNKGKGLEISMGYFTAPLFSILVGIAINKSLLNIYEKIALLSVIIGIMVKFIFYNKFPYIAFILGICFGSYSIIKKKLKINPIYGFTIENLFLLPCAIIFFYFNYYNLSFSLKNNLFNSTLMIVSGVITSLPIILFTLGAQKSSLITVGFCQYITPTIQLLISFFYLKEPVNNIQIISFGVIWFSIVSLSIGKLIKVNNENYKPKFKIKA